MQGARADWRRRATCNLNREWLMAATLLPGLAAGMGGEDLTSFFADQSGFTGAAVNAVTKCGTNRFQGSAYYIFAGDEINRLRPSPDQQGVTTF